MLKKDNYKYYSSVRLAIVENPNTPVEIIQKLTNDANKIVRAAAKDNLENKQKTNL